MKKVQLDSIYPVPNVMGRRLHLSTKKQLFDNISIYINGKMQTNSVVYWLKEETEHMIRALWAGKIRIKASEGKESWAYMKFELSKTAHSLLMTELQSKHPELYQTHLQRKQNRRKTNKEHKYKDENGNYSRVVKIKPRVSLK